MMPIRHHRHRCRLDTPPRAADGEARQRHTHTRRSVADERCMDGGVGPGSWVTFVDANGVSVEGRAVSETEMWRGAAVIWVGVTHVDTSVVTVAVPAERVRPVMLSM